MLFGVVVRCHSLAPHRIVADYKGGIYGDCRMKTTLTQTASHWGVYNVETDEAGAILNVHPFEGDREPSVLIRGLQSMVRSSLRIDQPYVRQGYLRNPGSKGPHNRGGEPFVPVSWDRALDLVADEFRRVKTEHGNEAIYGGSYGWASAGRPTTRRVSSSASLASMAAMSTSAATTASGQP